MTRVARGGRRKFLEKGCEKPLTHECAFDIISLLRCTTK
ncbi:hypothetical protein BURMUCF2_0891 [Burkholderia multivorans CF2]|nr:hypothetical protein BURMUCF2_0891 [Burkholderia multivorans CF2]